jgi:hypothetical protein
MSATCAASDYVPATLTKSSDSVNTARSHETYFDNYQPHDRQQHQ